MSAISRCDGSRTTSALPTREGMYSNFCNRVRVVIGKMHSLGKTSPNDVGKQKVTHPLGFSFVHLKNDCFISFWVMMSGAAGVGNYVRDRLRCVSFPLGAGLPQTSDDCVTLKQ